MAYKVIRIDFIGRTTVTDSGRFAAAEAPPERSRRRFICVVEGGVPAENIFDSGKVAGVRVEVGDGSYLHIPYSRAYSIRTSEEEGTVDYSSPYSRVVCSSSESLATSAKTESYAQYDLAKYAVSSDVSPQMAHSSCSSRSNCFSSSSGKGTITISAEIWSLISVSHASSPHHGART